MIDSNLTKLDIQKYILLLIYGAFCVAFIHEYAFFYAIDIQMSQFPLTIYDHLNNSIYWIPFFALSLFIGFTIGYTPHQVFENNDDYLKKHIRRLDRTYTLFIVISLLGYIIIGDAFILGLNIFIAFIFYNIIRYYSDSIIIHKIVFGGSLLVALVASLGYKEGYSAIVYSNHKTINNIEINEITYENSKILKNYGDSILLKTDNNLLFISLKYDYKIKRDIDKDKFWRGLKSYIAP